MICPTCGHDNLPGSEACSLCLQDLTQLDRPEPQSRVERSLMETQVSVLCPAEPITLPPTATVQQAIETMLAHNIGALLIVGEDRKLLGIFSERDLLCKVAGLYDDYAKLAVQDFMTANPEMVTCQDTLAFALHKMDVGGYRHMPVVRGGSPIGVVSVRNMLRHITRVCHDPS
jgi:CBS domain-containing protein